MNDYKSALAVAIRYLNHKDRTEHEIHERLAKDEYNKEIIAQIISYLKEQGYVNDSRYAEYYFVCYKEKRSLRRIEMELLGKGISQTLIDEIKESFDSVHDSQYTAVKKALKKQLIKRKIDDDSDISYEERCAIKAALYRQGFSSDIIAEVIADGMNNY